MISDITDRLNQDSLFRNGPSFLSKGVSAALEAKQLIFLKSIPFIQSMEKEARRSMIKTPTELALFNNQLFLTATGY